MEYNEINIETIKALTSAAMKAAIIMGKKDVDQSNADNAHRTIDLALEKVNEIIDGMSL